MIVSEPWEWREPRLQASNQRVRQTVRGVTNNVTQLAQVASGLVGYTTVALFVYMSMLRRDYREGKRYNK